MIRYNYIKQQITNTQKYFFIKSYPVNVLNIINQIPCCKIFSFFEFSKLNNAKISDIFSMCQSQTGCTFYHKTAKKYLILYNDDLTPGRIRWTLAHELGHILLRHFLSEGITEFQKEKEADLYAQQLLAPFEYFQIYNITNPISLMNFFGLSHEAALNTMLQYNKWKSNNNT